MPRSSTWAWFTGWPVLDLAPPGAQRCSRRCSVSGALPAAAEAAGGDAHFSTGPGNTLSRQFSHHLDGIAPGPAVAS